MKDLTGLKFNRLTVIGFVGQNKRYENLWLCKCDCGGENTVATTYLKKSRVKSCGCLVKEVCRETGLKSAKYLKGYGQNKSLGDWNTRFFAIYHQMNVRCSNKKHKSYKNYGGRGIKCLWRDYNEFKIDMFESYNKHLAEFGSKQTTLDRINNNLDYSKENCRWATYKEQNSNKRIRKDSLLITYNGEINNKFNWSKIAGISPGCFNLRYKNGWSMEKIMNTKSKGRGKGYQHFTK